MLVVEKKNPQEKGYVVKVEKLYDGDVIEIVQLPILVRGGVTTTVTVGPQPVKSPVQFVPVQVSVKLPVKQPHVPLPVVQVP